MIVDDEDENFDKQHPFVNLEFVPLSTCQPHLHSYSRPLLNWIQKLIMCMNVCFVSQDVWGFIQVSVL